MCVCVLRKPSSCYYCLLGGLAAEEPGELVAWGPCGRHPDTEETPTEHAHLDPSAAQEHEMETIGSASTAPAFIPRRSVCVHLFVCRCVFVCVFICASVRNTTAQTLDTRHQNQLINSQDRR